jgi:hypothetical protein
MSKGSVPEKKMIIKQILVIRYGWVNIYHFFFLEKTSNGTNLWKKKS